MPQGKYIYSLEVLPLKGIKILPPCFGSTYFIAFSRPTRALFISSRIHLTKLNRFFLAAAERVISATESNITRFEYDKAGNTTKVIKGLNSWQDNDFTTYSYEYDSLNRLILSADAENRKTQYKYDNNGNLVKLIDRNKVETAYTYDGLNRLIQKQNSKDGKKTAVNITIDKLGQTRKMTDASGTTVFEYDDLGRLTSINYGNGIRQDYAYDRAGRVSALKVLQGSLTQINLNYEYDNVGRLTAVNDNGKRFRYKYNDIGQLTEELNGVTGIKSTYQYYPSGNVRNLRHWDGSSIISSYEYKYDKRGNQIQKDEGNGTTKYYYDPLSRIKTALLPDDKIQNYEYDDLDNIKQVTEITGNKIEETSYLYDNNSRLLLQETTKGGETVQHRFTYDAVGNQLTKEDVFKINGNTMATKSFSYDYNGFNQLQRVQTPDNNFVEYTYNGNGLRTKKDFGDLVTNYYYNADNIILETDRDNAVTAANIRGLKLIYRENSSGQVDAQMLFYLHNAHGDVTQLLDETGQLIKDYRYDPFGQEETTPLPAFGGKQTTELWRQEVEKIDNPFRYCGEYLDEETGNYYLRARYYDPSIQRFTQKDSYGVERGAAWLDHLYGYCGNNPVRFIDPSGHIRVAGYYTINGVYDWYDDPDASEFGKDSDTYKILGDLGNRWTATDEQSQKDNYHQIAEDARSLARAETPYLYGQDIVMDTLHTNAQTGIDYMDSLLNNYWFLANGGDPLLTSYSWFVSMTCNDWDYKWDPYWQVGHNADDYGTFNGVDMNKKQSDGGYAKNWTAWIYFDGMLMGADKFGNLNLGYVGAKMGFFDIMLLNPATTGAGDGFWVEYGINMAKQGR
ncbi:RHS repeat domain-containing protein [Phosphitispora sp. TUW77]|uniref:RHS repeat domain-containing protein n=1 Tax=Phosphitispora sp. TUW77 TaxID=3152361 RepID=UPI003AB81A73